MKDESANKESFFIKQSKEMALKINENLVPVSKNKDFEYANL